MSDSDATYDGLDRLDLEVEFDPPPPRDWAEYGIVCGCVIPSERGLTSEAAQS
jgi:hypothetical protein